MATKNLIIDFEYSNWFARNFLLWSDNIWRTVLCSGRRDDKIAALFLYFLKFSATTFCIWKHKKGYRGPPRKHLFSPGCVIHMNFQQGAPTPLRSSIEVLPHFWESILFLVGGEMSQNAPYLFHGRYLPAVEDAMMDHERLKSTT